MSLMTKLSTEYYELVDEYKKLHSDPTMFPGKSTLKYAHYIKSIIRDNKCKTLLDYGSGKGYLYDGDSSYCKENLDKPLHKFWNLSSFRCYDPGVPEFSKLPMDDEKFDIVVAVDVMEHIPTQDLEFVLDERIMNFGNKAVFLNIACYEALKTFSNGKNVHVAVHEPNYWLDLIKKIWYNKHRDRLTLHITFEEVEDRFVSNGIFKAHVFYNT